MGQRLTNPWEAMHSAWAWSCSAIICWPIGVIEAIKLGMRPGRTGKGWTATTLTHARLARYADTFGVIPGAGCQRESIQPLSNNRVTAQIFHLVMMQSPSLQPTKPGTRWDKGCFRNTGARKLGKPMSRSIALVAASGET